MGHGALLVTSSLHLGLGKGLDAGVQDGGTNGDSSQQPGVEEQGHQQQPDRPAPIPMPAHQA